MLEDTISQRERRKIHTTHGSKKRGIMDTQTTISSIIMDVEDMTGWPLKKFWRNMESDGNMEIAIKGGTR